MAILDIPKKEDNPILREVAKPVKKVDKKLRKLIKDMEETMYNINGVGLAAPQIGLSIQLAVARLNPETKNELILVLINPKITYQSEEMTKMEEGCLSVPGTWGDTLRHKQIIFTYQDLKGQEITLSLEGFNARIIQHEIDHLNGKLYLDHCEKVHEE
ncbi:peptide deformylase [Candidatus Peregrinibacteria bacterium]|jgi:peptide deformylase|nr:peptide deformylase [Candidatus Peregrinibacteria bacterium]MBT7484164.1 peptide deformylase [Candidatus Peregrinibacteria bacterium]MBT7702914.1 peptide deformylase [Candidatus Peregrinibacteria bacterium]